jgi:hypothetical protein
MARERYARGFARAQAAELEAQIGSNALDWIVFETLSTLSLADMLIGRANPLARDEFEFKVMTAVLRAAWIDRTYFDLSSLARMSIPNLNGASSRSDALSVMRGGMSAMLTGGAGVAAGWATGSGAVTLLASSGASVGVACAADYLKKLQERRSNKAVLDLALAFKREIS